MWREKERNLLSYRGNWVLMESWVRENARGKKNGDGKGHLKTFVLRRREVKRLGNYAKRTF